MRFLTSSHSWGVRAESRMRFRLASCTNFTFGSEPISREIYIVFPGFSAPGTTSRLTKVLLRSKIVRARSCSDR